jgi:hypothetical protein
MRKHLSPLLCLLLAALLCCPSALADTPAVADTSQMTAVEEVVEEGMTPVYADSLIDGDYPVRVKSSSSMFRIESAVLHVRDAKLSATLTLGSKSYLALYPGSALEAATADESGRIPYTEDADGAYAFTIPVEALDAPVPCAAFSKNKQLWYDRTLLFRADSLPQEALKNAPAGVTPDLADGTYSVEVSLSGGSGRASVESPATLTVEKGVCTARIVWSSPNYDYMLTSEGERLEPVNTEGNSAFDVPVSVFGAPVPVQADTTAMSQPHLIDYTLTFDSGSIAQK